MTIAAARRRPDRDEHRIRLAHGGKLGGEGKPAMLRIGGDEIGKTRLVNRNDAALERRDLVGVLVDTGDVMAEIGKAGA